MLSASPRPAPPVGPSRGRGPRACLHVAAPLVVVLLASACSDSDPTDPFDAGDFPVGTFEVTLQGPEGETTWQTVWDEDGSLEVTVEGQQVAGSEYTVEGDEVEIQDVSGGGACPESQVGRYRWAFDAPELTLEEISDGCGARASVLAAEAWVRQ